MSTFWNRLAHQWRDVANLVLGLWVLISPWALGFAAEPTAQAAVWNANVVGVIIAVAALAAIVQFHKWEEWVNAILAAWLIVSPWIFGVAALSALLWNQIIIGLVIGALALWTALAGYEPEQEAKEH